MSREAFQFPELSDEHVGLHGLSFPTLKRRRNRKSAAMAELAKITRTLEAIVTQRFAREEGPGGFFSFVLAAAPRYLSMIDALRAEHATIGHRLAVLREEIADATLPEWGALVGELNDIIFALDEHESLEREILRDALDP
jgi:iron-sulfur cluster repair protein YtfE (RIC family)